jgi:hypothetical protein
MGVHVKVVESPEGDAEGFATELQLVVRAVFDPVRLHWNNKRGARLLVVECFVLADSLMCRLGFSVFVQEGSYEDLSSRFREPNHDQCPDQFLESNVHLTPR